MTIRQALQKGMIELKGNSIDTPNLKARLLMQFILKQTRQYIIVHDEEKLDKRQEENYFKAIEELKENKPIEHITHQKEFMKLNFYVSEKVLIPRQDTEILVEEVIKIAKKTQARKILDLCTGSGVIAISLAKYLPESEITAVDISRAALEVAIKNAKKNQVENQITFVESDLMEQLGMEKYDIIVSNPPYIEKQELEKLEKQVQKEPKIALDGGWDGLTFYRKMIAKAYEYLKYKGYLAFEIGYNQKEEVCNLIKEEGKYSNPYCLKDLYDQDRVIITKLNLNEK